MNRRIFLKHSSTILASMSIAGCFETDSCTKLYEPKQPNFLLIIADDMTYTDLGCYGNKQVRTPNLDKLAKQSLKFNYCFNSAPMCAPTRMSLYTAIHPVRNGAHPNHSKVYPDIKSMPHYLSNLGYHCALIGKKHYKPEKNFPFKYLGGRNHDNGDNGTDLLISKAHDFFKDNKSKPWCLVVASNQPHTPWNRGDPSQYKASELTLPPYMVDTPETRQAMTKYYAEITYLDDQVGQVLAGLEKSGQTENTLVVFLSEQGSTYPHCKWTCYETGLGSACLLRWPGITKPETSTDAMIQYIDILPTFIEAAGGDPTKLDFDGKSIVALLKGKTNKHRDYTFGIQTSKGIIAGPKAYGIRSVRDKQYRLIWNLNYDTQFQNTVTKNFAPYLSWQTKANTGDTFAQQQYDRYKNRPEFELYDLVNDPYEMTNIINNSEHKTKIAELKKQLHQWMTQQNDKGIETEKQALTRQ
ncbi:MAG: sulfatase [Phycisphaerae bacterium]|nr:sulfatase [Phycisphaerae bacterium]